MPPVPRARHQRVVFCADARLLGPPTASGWNARPIRPACTLCMQPNAHPLTVCSYDLRFPEQFQKLTWGLGAQLLAVPAAFTKPTGGCCMAVR